MDAEEALGPTALLPVMRSLLAPSSTTTSDGPPEPASAAEV
jgi:hypothetical protein